MKCVCEKPYQLKTTVFGQARCGSCPACRKVIKSLWTDRIMHEYRHGPQKDAGAVFVTLTYTDHHLPRSRSLRKKDLQDFIKRLRKRLSSPIRYIFSGEYGKSATHRPHYHGIIFGLQHTAENEELILSTWGMCTADHYDIGDLSGSKAAAYVGGYSLKKMVNSYSPRRGQEPEFKIQSLGLGYGIVETLKNTNNNDPEKHCNLYENMLYYNQGQKLLLPRHYRKRLARDIGDEKVKAATAKGVDILSRQSPRTIYTPGERKKINEAILHDQYRRHEAKGDEIF